MNLENFLGGSIVLQFEPTQKLFSRKLYNPYTVFYHTFFDLKLVYEVGPESFLPPPTVKSALLDIKRKQLIFDFKLLNSSYKCNGIHINNLFKFFVWCEVSKSFTRSII